MKTNRTPNTPVSVFRRLCGAGLCLAVCSVLAAIVSFCWPSARTSPLNRVGFVRNALNCTIQFEGDYLSGVARQAAETELADLAVNPASVNPDGYFDAEISAPNDAEEDVAPLVNVSANTSDAAEFGNVPDAGVTSSYAWTDEVKWLSYAPSAVQDKEEVPELQEDDEFFPDLFADWSFDKQENAEATAEKGPSDMFVAETKATEVSQTSALVPSKTQKTPLLHEPVYVASEPSRIGGSVHRGAAPGVGFAAVRVQ